MPGPFPFVQAWGGVWRNVPSAGSGQPAEIRLQFSSNQIPAVFIEEDMGSGNFQMRASTPATQTPGGPFVQTYNFTPVSGSGVVRITLALANDQPVVVDSVLYRVLGPLVTQSVLVWNTYNDYEGYRYGYNGQDKVSQSFGEGAHTTAQFWEYDTRLARRWNIDPVDQIGISNYAVNGLNSIANSDILGNKWINVLHSTEYKQALETVESWQRSLEQAIAQNDPVAIDAASNVLQSVLKQKNEIALKMSSDAQMIDKIFEQMKVENLALYNYWDNLQINGKDFEIRVKGQVDPIIYTNPANPSARFETGEGISNVSNSNGTTYVNLILQTTSVNDENTPKVRAENAWHGIGHAWSQMNNMEYGSHDEDGRVPGEDNAVKYSIRANGGKEGKPNTVEQVHNFDGYIRFRGKW